MAQVIQSIAPGVVFGPNDLVSVSSLDQVASAITQLQHDGCNIIVDDIVGDDETSSQTTAIDNAINAASRARITYITAAGNDAATITARVSGHQQDSNALVVGAMNILATPNASVGSYMPTSTEVSSQEAVSDVVPGNFITGPDGGPTNFPLPAPGQATDQFNPFFGTSAAAPAVAAVAALTMQEDPALESSPLQVYQLLELSASRFVDSKNAGSSLGEGAGFVQADQAVALAAALCFCAGTLITTPNGRVPVEHLAVGDVVLTHTREARPIVWIGIGHVLATRGLRSAATPVIVRKGALAANVPHRDLHITKGHSLYLDDVLIPVEFLVNNRTIVWDDHAQEVVLYHLELAIHDVLLANGAPAESYRDDGNRWLFQNVNNGWEQPPKPPCAPVLTGGPIVDAAWRRLLDRAGPRPGLPLTDEPDLYLMVNGQRVDGSLRPNGYCVFDLPQRPSELRVVSRAGSPAELGLARDPRLLGVAVRQVRLWQGARLRILDASDESLVQGFHAFEPDNGFRWTDGDALLPATLFSNFEGACQLELLLSGGMRYPLYAEAVGQAAA